MRASVLQLLFVSAVVMGLAQTLTKERIFEPLRTLCGGKERWLGYLVSCPYCASHYFAFALVPLTGSYFIPVAVDWGIGTRILEWFLSSILVTVVAAFLRVAFWFVDETQGLVRRRQKREEEVTRKERLHRKKVERELTEDGTLDA